MPTILREAGFRLFFYSNEGNEPPHIHVEKADASAKIWLQPIELENNYGFTSREMNQILRIVANNQNVLIQSWYDYFG